MKIVAYSLITILMFGLMGLGAFFGFWSAVSSLVGSFEAEWFIYCVLCFAGSAAVSIAADKIEDTL